MAITNLSHVREDWGKVEIGQENFSEDTWHQTKIWPHPYHGFISPAFGLFDTDAAILFYDIVCWLDYSRETSIRMERY